MTLDRATMHSDVTSGEENPQLVIMGIMGGCSALALTPAEARRFATKVRIDGNGCWIWTASLNSKGYACLGLRKKRWLGHRLSYSVVHGPIPEGHDVDHLCRVKACVNPEHGEAVEPGENARRHRLYGGLPVGKLTPRGVRPQPLRTLARLPTTGTELVASIVDAARRDAERYRAEDRRAADLIGKILAGEMPDTVRYRRAA